MDRLWKQRRSRTAAPKGWSPSERVAEIPYSPQQPHPGKQTEFLKLGNREALYGGAGGGGKALDVETLIPTPDGWRRMGDLQPGDEVFRMNGLPTKVVAVSEVMEHRPCYRLAFDDGSQIVADAEHLWLTYNVAEMAALTRRDDNWRAARRARRVSRVSGFRSGKFTAAVTARNQSSPPPCLPPPAGAVRPTREIGETLRPKRGRANHAVPLALPLQMGESHVVLEPYLLGVWLGDGNSSSGYITTADPEIVEEFTLAGFRVTPAAGKYHYRVEHLGRFLKELGVLRNKHIPEPYLWASAEQRLELLQGLMDTDGNCCTDGQAQFCSTNESLARGVFTLAAGLGLKPTIRESRARLYGKDCGPKWNVFWTAALPVFRLSRKRERLREETRRVTRFRYIVGCEPVESVPVRCIQVAAADGMFLAGEGMIPTHNSSALLMAALQYVDTPGYAALLLRRTYADLALPGALMSRAQEWLQGTDAHWNATEKTWTFPSGATMTFGYMKNDAERFRYQGAELQFVGWDELTQFSEVQYRYLFTRLRRLKGVQVPLRVRGATNPGGFGHEWVKARFKIPKDRPEGVWEVPGTQRVWVPALLDDNPALDREEYIESLNELDPVTKAQMLAGDWEIQFEGELFRRAWFPIKDAVPVNGKAVRYWDLAATEVTAKAGSDPDFTVGCKLLLLPDQTFFVADIIRVRQSPGDVKKLIVQTARLDGAGCMVRMEQEPGSSGKSVVADYCRALAGWPVLGVRSTGSKVTRAKPVSAQAQAGNIAVLNATWADSFLQELTLFPQEGVHDDQVDALSGAFQALTEENVNPLAGMAIQFGVRGWMAK